MLSNEIEKLHKKLEQRLKDRDMEKDDKDIAVMAEHRGWEVLKGLMEGMIAELLEPVDFSDETPLEVRGSIGDARYFTLKSLRTVIGTVESTKSAKRIEKEEKKKQEEEKDNNV